MKITEVRIFPTESKDGKLKAFATMTFDDWFVVRNVKVIQGNSGLFVAMPSRKAMDSCPKCRFKNVVGSKYCNQCGAQLEQKQVSQEETSEARGAHMDIAHPISQECRVYIQDKILEAYNKEHSEPKAPGEAPSSPEAPKEDAPEESEKKDVSSEPAATDSELPTPNSDEGEKLDMIETEEGKDIEL